MSTEQQSPPKTRAETRAAFVRASNRRVWRITAVACVAILGLGLAIATFIQRGADQAKSDRERQREQDATEQLQRRQAADIACVKKWADAYSARADRLARLGQPRQDALDDLVAAVPLHNAAIFDHRLHVYLAARDRYKQALRDNPLPPAPTFSCGLGGTNRPFVPGASSSPRVPSPSRPGSTAHAAGAPSPTPGATVRPTSSSSSAPVAGHVTTVPGPTRTVTRTATSPAPPGRPSAPVLGILCSSAQQLLPGLRLCG